MPAPSARSAHGSCWNLRAEPRRPLRDRGVVPLYDFGKRRQDGWPCRRAAREPHAPDPALVSTRRAAVSRAAPCSKSSYSAAWGDHDRSVLERGRPRDDGLGPPSRDAIEASRRPADECDPRKTHAAYGRDAGVAERGAEEPGPRARCSFDRSPCPDDPVAYRPRHAERVQPIVGITVYGEGVTARVNLAYHVWMAAHLLAQHEERRPVACRCERLEHPSRRHRVRTVVEGERDARAPCWAMGDDTRVHLEPWAEHARRGERAPAERQRAHHGKTRLAAHRGMQRERAESRGRREQRCPGRARHPTPHTCV